jgi:hypothetical protein
MKSEKLGLITKDECEDTDVVNITKEIADQVKKKRVFTYLLEHFIDLYLLVLD